MKKRERSDKTENTIKRHTLQLISESSTQRTKKHHRERRDLVVTMILYEQYHRKKPHEEVYILHTKKHTLEDTKKLSQEISTIIDTTKRENEARHWLVRWKRRVYIRLTPWPTLVRLCETRATLWEKKINKSSAKKLIILRRRRIMKTMNIDTSEYNILYATRENKCACRSAEESTEQRAWWLTQT